MKKIIVADDDFQQRDLYVELFKSAGFDVIAANDGQDAWEKTVKEYPDLIFTGIMMPRMTGFELIEKLRADKSTQPIPVIIFSHLGRETDRVKAKSLWNVLFKVKGYDSPADILHSAQHLVEKTSPHIGSPHPATSASSEDERPPANLL